MNYDSPTEINQNIIAGRNSIYEAVKSGRNIDSIYIVKNNHNQSLDKILSLAKDEKIPIKLSDKRHLDKLSNNTSHQGIVAIASLRKYSSVDDMLELAKQKNEKPFIIIADKIQDPHNLGALIRTAECSGAHGIIIPNRRCANVTETVDKVSCGASEYVLISRVNNLSSTIDYLKSQGVWIYCADMDGTTWCNHDFKESIALVVGSEGNGVSHLVKQKCDFVVSLPLRGKITSLNASVSAGVLMYEVVRQRFNF